MGRPIFHEHLNWAQFVFELNPHHLILLIIIWHKLGVKLESHFYWCSHCQSIEILYLYSTLIMWQYACTKMASEILIEDGMTIIVQNKPLSLSTRITTTHSCLPTLISLLMERIRLLDNSLRRIIPSMLLYSNKFTYAPISAILRTLTMTTSSISGYLCL